MIVYPIAFLLGAVGGLLVPFKNGRRLAICAAALGLAAALYATWESLAFLAPDFSVRELLLQLTLPAAAICFVLGLIGTYLGSALQWLGRRLILLIVETGRLG